jgi:uncharacterized BrkB/YihY/UPF0761 family membrane protein
LPQVNWVERQVRGVDRFQQQHVVLAFPWAVAQKFGDDQAGGKAALTAYYGLFALFPLRLLLATILGFVLSGNPALREQLIDSAVAHGAAAPLLAVAEAADEDPLDNLDDGG